MKNTPKIVMPKNLKVRSSAKSTPSNKLSRFAIFDEIEFMNELIVQVKRNKSLHNKFNTVNKLVTEFANKLEYICKKPPNQNTLDYSESSIRRGYMADIIRNIYKITKKQLPINEFYTYEEKINNDNEYRFIIVYDRLSNLMDGVVNILIYKSGCKGLEKRFNITQNEVMQYTVICQNKDFKTYTGTGRMMFDLTYAWLDALKKQKYKYVILEVASNTDNPSEYGNGASLHLLSLYAGMGFVEDPQIALKDHCFQPGYNYNSMILDLKNVNDITDDIHKVANKISYLQNKAKKLAKDSNEYKEIDTKLKMLGNPNKSYYEKLKLLDMEDHYDKLNIPIPQPTSTQIIPTKPSKPIKPSAPVSTRLRHRTKSTKKQQGNGKVCNKCHKFMY